MLKAWGLDFYIHIFRSKSELSDPFEVLFDDISLDTIIGEGAFGKVYSGMLLKQTVEANKGRKSSKRKADKEQQQIKRSPTVAVKMLQSMIWLCNVLYALRGSSRWNPSINEARHTKIVITSKSFTAEIWHDATAWHNIATISEVDHHRFAVISTEKILCIRGFRFTLKSDYSVYLRR